MSYVVGYTGLGAFVSDCQGGSGPCCNTPPETWTNQEYKNNAGMTRWRAFNENRFLALCRLLRVEDGSREFSTLIDRLVYDAENEGKVISADPNRILQRVYWAGRNFEALFPRSRWQPSSFATKCSIPSTWPSVWPGGAVDTGSTEYLRAYKMAYQNNGLWMMGAIYEQANNEAGLDAEDESTNSFFSPQKRADFLGWKRAVANYLQGIPWSGADDPVVAGGGVGQVLDDNAAIPWVVSVRPIAEAEKPLYPPGTTDVVFFQDNFAKLLNLLAGAAPYPELPKGARIRQAEMVSKISSAQPPPQIFSTAKSQMVKQAILNYKPPAVQSKAPAVTSSGTVSRVSTSTEADGMGWAWWVGGGVALLGAGYLYQRTRKR